MDPARQWRVNNAKHLQGLELQFRPYTAWSRDWDHDHCAACWAKFSAFGDSDIRQEGYAIGPDYPKGTGYEWVCQQCFADLKTEMGWTSLAR
jgi:hypothetical protein